MIKLTYKKFNLVDGPVCRRLNLEVDHFYSHFVEYVEAEDAFGRSRHHAYHAVVYKSHTNSESDLQRQQPNFSRPPILRPNDLQ